MGPSGPNYTARFSLRFDRGQGVESPRADYSTASGSITPTLFQNQPGYRLNWSVTFFTSDGIEVPIACRAVVRPDRTFFTSGDNPTCMFNSDSLTGFAQFFSVVVTELSSNTLELRSDRIQFGNTMVVTNFALRLEGMNPPTWPLTPRADFRPTL